MSVGSGLGSPLVAVRVLPPAAAVVADLTVAGVYVPAGPGPEPIAGDFWDVLPAAGGLVSLLVGDVCGHGEAAVTRMQALRTAAAACVLVDPRPASVLERLDTIMQALGLEDLATMWCGLYDPRSGALVYSSAGHPPPAVRPLGGPSRPLALADAPPLGTGFVGRPSEHVADVEPGAVLVAYSDGLIERHGAHFDDQIALLAAVVDAACGPAEPGAPEDIAADVMRALVPEPDDATDDVCLLVVRRVRSEPDRPVDRATVDARSPVARQAPVVAVATATFAPAPISVRGARHLLRSFLADHDLDGDFADGAELALSEVVTNAVLHAHTDFDVALLLEGPRLRVEVRDSNPQLPVQRGYAEQATTGRGMELVAAYTADCGVDPDGPHGKTVWFVVDGTAAGQDPSAQDLLDAWGIDLDDAGSAPVGGGSVMLLSLPPTLWLAAREHHDAVLRELALYAAEHPEAAPVPERLALADTARACVSTRVVAELDRRAAPAATAHRLLPAGHPSPLRDAPVSLDLDVPVPENAAEAFAALQDVLDAAEALAVRGLLLARPGLPEIVAVRDWACEQAISQCRGVLPSPWPGTGQERFTALVHDRDQPVLPDWDTSVVADSDLGAVAADDANRIIAVSRPLAAVLGWAVEDLVGRRVVVLIPPELREAHVAGFTRHLTTGETHAIGVPLRLPVLRADGTRVDCDFLIEQTPATTGRAVYIAWIQPDPQP